VNIEKNEILSNKTAQPDTEKLRIYSSIKHEIADCIRILKESFITLGSETGEKECSELTVKLAEDHFYLAVLGQFKRGKSSLMNAIIGRDILPTGILPLTSVVTIIKYGTEDKLIINRKDSSFHEELPINELDEYVTEKNNPGNHKKIKTVTVELPVSFLRRGIKLADTPGIGSSINANTATTYDFLPECDAALFVTGTDSPMTAAEIDFLKDVREFAGKIFFVVNKIDLVKETEKNEVLNFVGETIQKTIGRSNIRLYPVSALQGIASKVGSNDSLYKISGIKFLEEDLAVFLAEEKTNVFLSGICWKLLKIIEKQVEMKIFEHDYLHFRHHFYEENKSKTLFRDTYEAVANIETTRTKIESIIENLSNGHFDKVLVRSIPKLFPVTDYIDATQKNNVTSLTHQKNGCPICKRIMSYTFSYFSTFQYNLASKDAIRDSFASELGFCPYHSWFLLSVSSPVGSSLGYSKLSEYISSELNHCISKVNPETEIKKLVRNQENCRVCKLIHEEEKKYIAEFADSITENDEFKKYTKSNGLCLRHLSLLISKIPERSMVEQLIRHSSQKFEEYAEDMRSYTMKRDALRRSLINKNEEKAFREAVIHLSGERGLCMPWREDSKI
jgi:GTP-binding protein EngB required for normal cell division